MLSRFDILRASADKRSEPAISWVIQDPRRVLRALISHLPEIAQGQSISWKPQSIFFPNATENKVLTAFDSTREAPEQRTNLSPEKTLLRGLAEEQLQRKLFDLIETHARLSPEITKIAREMIDQDVRALDEKLASGIILQKLVLLLDLPQVRIEDLLDNVFPSLLAWGGITSLTTSDFSQIIDKRRALVDPALTIPESDRAKRLRAFQACFSVLTESALFLVKRKNDVRLQELGKLIAKEKADAIPQLHSVLHGLYEEARLTSALRGHNKVLFEEQAYAAGIFKLLTTLRPKDCERSEVGGTIPSCALRATIERDYETLSALSFVLTAFAVPYKLAYVSRKVPELPLLAHELFPLREVLAEKLTGVPPKVAAAHLDTALLRNARSALRLLPSECADLLVSGYKRAISLLEEHSNVPPVLSPSVSAELGTIITREWKKVVLVTGASQGLGHALVTKLAQRGQDTLVIATARKRSLGALYDLQKRYPDNIIVRPLDVTVPLERERLIADLQNRGIRVNVLVNNAGICGRGAFETLSEEELTQQIQTNVFGGAELARLVLPEMRRTRDGQIIVISSLSGMMGVPTMGGYSASKFALEGLYESLYYEVKPLDIKVTLMQLGFIRSQSFINSRFSRQTIESVERGGAYGQMTLLMNRGITIGMRFGSSTPRGVAAVTESLIDDPHPPLRRVVGLDGHLFTLFRRFIPRSLYHKAVYHSLYGRRLWSEALREEQRAMNEVDEENE